MTPNISCRSSFQIGLQIQRWRTKLGRARVWLHLKRLYLISSVIAYCISPYASFYARLSCFYYYLSRSHIRVPFDKRPRRNIFWAIVTSDGCWMVSFGRTGIANWPLNVETRTAGFTFDLPTANTLNSSLENLLIRLSISAFSKKMLSYAGYDKKIRNSDCRKQILHTIYLQVVLEIEMQQLNSSLKIEMLPWDLATFKILELALYCDRIVVYSVRIAWTFLKPQNKSIRDGNEM